MNLDELSFHDAVSPHHQARYRGSILRDDLAQRGLTRVPVTIVEAQMKRDAGDISPNPLKLYLTLNFDHTTTEIAYSRGEGIEHLLQLAGAGTLEQLQGMRFKAYLKDKEVLALRRYN